MRRGVDADRWLSAAAGRFGQQENRYLRALYGALPDYEGTDAGQWDDDCQRDDGDRGAGFAGKTVFVGDDAVVGSEGNDAPIVVTRAIWRSRELGLVVRSVVDDPRIGTETRQLLSLEQGEPNAELFAPPAEYRVVRKEFPGSLVRSRWHLSGWASDSGRGLGVYLEGWRG